MKKNKQSSKDMRSEYKKSDLGKGTRGKYVDAFNSGTNLFLINPDIAAFFKTQENINKVLKDIMDLAKKTSKIAKS